ncbi:MAG: flagellar motor switch protein FliM [Lautropia sp.]
MADQFLSQDEIDALLDAPAAADPGTAAGDDGPQPYDLARQERIVRGRLPALELIHERFARNLRLGLFNFMRRNPEISAEPVVIGKYATFMSSLAVPSSINVMQLKPLTGSALLVIDPTLVASVIDIMFGGSGRIRTQVEGREFSATEQRMILRMIELICGEYRRAWEGVYPLELVYARSEMQPQFANIAPSTEIVVTARFAVHLGELEGAIHLCIPYTALEPIRETLVSSISSNAPSHERGWLGALSREIKPANVELIAELATAEITIGELLNLSAGDIVEIDAGPEALLKIGQIPVFGGRYGEHNGHYAVRIDTVHAISQATPDRTQD